MSHIKEIDVYTTDSPYDILKSHKLMGVHPKNRPPENCFQKYGKSYHIHVNVLSSVAFAIPDSVDRTCVGLSDQFSLQIVARVLRFNIRPMCIPNPIFRDKGGTFCWCEFFIFQTLHSVAILVTQK